MGQRRLARAAYDAGGDDTRQIVDNIRAMERAIELGSEARSFTREDLIEIHKMLLEATRDRHLAGLCARSRTGLGATASAPRTQSASRQRPSVSTICCAT